GILAKQDGRWIEKRQLHARAHRVQIRELVLLRVDLLRPHLLEEFRLLKRTLGNSDNAGPLRGPIADQGKLFHVLVRIDAHLLQRSLELLEVVGQHAVFQRPRSLRITQGTVIHRNDLLDSGRNNCASVAAEGGGERRQAEHAAQKNAGKKPLHSHHSTRL